jgi:competence protein ComGC
MNHLMKKTAGITAGFTLVEVLTSSVILLVVMILLLCMGNGTLQHWRRSEGRREALRELYASLQIITDDLHSSVITTNKDSLQFHTSEEKGENSNSLFFLVAHPGDKKSPELKGDLCATGYFTAQDPKKPGHTNLYRFHASGKTLLDALGEGSLDHLYKSASPTNRVTTELLARNISELNVRRLDEETDHPPEILEVSLAAINAGTAGIIASDGMASLRNERLSKRDCERATAIIHLPPWRETPH